jgi:hypothetical protein
MTYSSEIQKEGKESGLLVVMKPRRLVSTWSVHSGSVYQASFDYGFVSGVEKNGTALTEVSSLAAVVSGSFYFDPDLQKIYVHLGGSAPSSFTMVAVFEIFATDFGGGLYWYRIPTSSSSRKVFFEPMLVNRPIIRAGLPDVVFGLMPSQSSLLELSNMDQYWNRLIHDSSVIDGDVTIYHFVKPLEVANVSQIYRGIMGDQVSFKTDAVSIPMQDRVGLFDRGFGGKFYPATLFGAETVDPHAVGRPINSVFGRADGVRGVDVTYHDPPNTGLSTVWAFAQLNTLRDSGAGSTSSYSVTSGGSTTRTYLTATPSKIAVGDYVCFQVGSTYYPTEVTAVGSNYLDHQAISATLSSGTCYYSAITRVQIIQDGKLYKAYPKRDYSYLSKAYNYAGDPQDGLGCIEIGMFATDKIGLARALAPWDTVSARVYGRDTRPTLGGATFGSLDSLTQTVTNPVVILYDLLKTFVGIPEADIDTATFQTMAATLTDRIGIRAPERVFGDFPTYKEMFAQILASSLLRLYLDANGRWSLARVMPLGTATKELDDEAVSDRSVSFQYSFRDILSDVIVEYEKREVSENVGDTDGSAKSILVTSSTARYLHKVSRQETFHSLHLDSSGATTWANRLSKIFGERRGTIKLTTAHNAYLDTTVGAVAELARKKLPGNAYDGETTHERKLVVVDVEKTSNRITLTGDDQKGIEDNSGSW